MKACIKRHRVRENNIWDIVCLVQQLMSLKNQEQQQNLFKQDSPAQDESYECNETISDISLEFNQQKRLRQCQCTCRCKLKSPQTIDPLEKKEKKRLKRKNNKMKLRNKQKELQQKALSGLEQIIKDIYSLRINFEDVQKEVEEFITIDINRDKFYELINSIIRDQVEVIRKEIANYLYLLSNTKECYEQELIKGLFYKLQVIKEASPQIQKIINLFVGIHFNPQVEYPPFQKNLDEMTFSFLIKNYLQKQVTNDEIKRSFVKLCNIIFEKQEYSQERELFQLMMAAYNKYDPQDTDSDQEYSDQEYDSEDWEEDNAKRSINFSIQQQQNESKSRKRRERKRRMKQQHEQNYQSILKRMESMSINQAERVNCNVEEDWIQDIIRKRDSYIKVNTFNVQ